MANHALCVFDIDGTLTMEGRDSWYEVTRAHATDVTRFDEGIGTWRRERAKNPVAASKKMMLLGIELFAKDVSSKQLEASVFDIFMREIDRGSLLRPKAVGVLRAKIAEGKQIIFATTSYIECARALVAALRESKVVENFSDIVVTGTQVDWSQRDLLTFNMADEKLRSIQKVFGLSENELGEAIIEAYGDDPVGNDSAILKAAKRSFIVTTDKNFDFDHTSIGASRLQW